MLKSLAGAVLVASSLVTLGGCASRAELVGAGTGAALGAGVGGGTMGAVGGGLVGYAAGRHYDEQHH